MIADKCGRDVPDVAGEIDEDGEQRAELNNGNRRGGELRAHGIILVKIDGATGEDQMRRRANRDEFRQPLNDAEDDSLEYGHKLNWVFVRSEMFSTKNCPKRVLQCVMILLFQLTELPQY